MKAAINLTRQTLSARRFCCERDQKGAICDTITPRVIKDLVEM